MLILPLHRSLTRSNFPLVTVLLILANIFVFAILQTGDEAAEKRAIDYYQQSDLGTIEFPAYAKWLSLHGGDAKKISAAQNGEGGEQFILIESDGKFLADLHADRVILPTDPGYAGWHIKRAQFDEILDSSFSRSHELRNSHFEPARILWSMFMHGGLEHIFWNMLFLAILGMLVEGSLGSGWFLGLYLVGGIVAALTTLAWHWGEEGDSLGASGAIAAVMGAFCVLWGSHKVRVFYWFVVFFDYVKVPALVLLPFWFVALVLLPMLSTGSHTDFADHAGGILCGVVLGFALQRGGAVRKAFIEEDERAEKQEFSDAEFEKAQQYLGQLEIPKARALFERIDKAEPGQLRVLVALFRCARYRGVPAEMDAAATRALGFPVVTDADSLELKSVFEDYAKACAGVPRLSPQLLMALLPIFQRVHEDAAMEALLRGVAAREPTFPDLPSAWFALAMRAPESSPKRRARLEFLVQNYTHSEFAPKAQFLLSQG